MLPPARQMRGGAGNSRGAHTAAMSLLQDALRAGHASPRRRAVAAPRVLVAGGGGALGSALLEELLGARRHAQVSVLVTQPLQTAMRGLSPLPWPPPAGGPALDATAVVVFDRERGLHGRELAFYRPQPGELLDLASQLHAGGVRHLLVVLPHTQATLPDALKRGLAGLSEQAVAALGFEHLVLVRTAQAPGRVRHAHPAQRLAHWMLSQLQMMVPEQERPVRAQKVARFAARLATGLPSSAPGTRVVPPEVVWAAAQSRDAATVADRWLGAP